MTRKWRLSTSRSQRERERQTDRQTDCNVKAPSAGEISDWTWPNSVYLRLWLHTALFSRREISSQDSSPPLKLFFLFFFFFSSCFIRSEMLR